jgi:hypothetical protein
LFEAVLGVFFFINSGLLIADIKLPSAVNVVDHASRAQWWTLVTAEYQLQVRNTQQLRDPFLSMSCSNCPDE